MSSSKAANNNQPCTPLAFQFVRYDSQNKKHNPKKTLTCLQVQSIEKEKQVANKITQCYQCGSYQLERFDNARLRHLKDNNPLTTEGVSYQYGCQTLWIAHCNQPSTNL